MSEEHQHGAGWRALDIAVLCSLAILTMTLIAAYLTHVRSETALVKVLAATDAPDVAEGVAPVPTPPRRVKRVKGSDLSINLDELESP